MKTAGRNRLSTELLRIMYDPLAYAAPAPGENAARPAHCIAWQNRQWIERHQLACQIDFSLDGEPRWWIEHWARLRRIAFLIGSRCLRDALASERRLLHLDAVACRFALLPLLAPRADPSLLYGGPLDDRALHAQGFRLLDSLARGLPIALQQRLAMLFADVMPADVPPAKALAARVPSGDARGAGASAPPVQTPSTYPMLISTATRYAQAHPH